MDKFYLRQIVNEMHDELVQRTKTYAKLIASQKMTPDEAYHRYLCLQNAKWRIEAEIGNEAAMDPSKYKSPSEVGEELLLEIAFRKDKAFAAWRKSRPAKREDS